ncbi:MAG: hypothetical protein JSS83_05880 [Cyanobacteria bacterium SZAS LIN-3]|nr:hypothetical protein [Cyanobacteria bacterium SZAS LIN-3]
MVPLAKASAILKISRDELISRLSAGELLGEKRRIGESKKDSWFIYADEYNRLMNQAVARYEERVSVKGLDHIFQSNQNARPEPVSPEPPSQAETIAIEPVAVVHSEHDPAQVVDALSPSDKMHDLQIGQAMVAQLVQHLHEERLTSENLKVRLLVLEEEVDQMRRELLGRPDARSQSPFGRMAAYFRALFPFTARH